MKWQNDNDLPNERIPKIFITKMKLCNLNQISWSNEIKSWKSGSIYIISEVLRGSIPLDSNQNMMNILSFCVLSPCAIFNQMKSKWFENQSNGTISNIL